MIFAKNKGERKMFVDMGKMQESEGRKSLSLSSKSKIKRKDKNKGKKIQKTLQGLETNMLQQSQIQKVKTVSLF